MLSCLCRQRLAHVQLDEMGFDLPVRTPCTAPSISVPDHPDRHARRVKHAQVPHSCQTPESAQLALDPESRSDDELHEGE